MRGTRSQANVSSPRLPPCRQTSEQDQPDPGVHSARTVPLVRLEAELESGTRAASGQAVGVTSNGLAPERAAVDALVVVHGGVGGPNEQILARGKAEGVDRKAVWQHVELKRRRAQGMRYEGHVQRRSEPMTADFCRSRWLRVTGAPLPCANCCRRPTTASAASSEMAVTGGLISLSSPQAKCLLRGCSSRAHPSAPSPSAGQRYVSFRRTAFLGQGSPDLAASRRLARGLCRYLRAGRRASRAADRHDDEGRAVTEHG